MHNKKGMSFKAIALGIIGGGQLGKMLIQEAVNYNLKISVLDPDKDAPCRFLCESFSCGSLQDFDTVYEFGKKQELVTIEIEHVNVDALFCLEQEGIPVYPQPQVLKMVQDKGLQKLFYTNHQIPTADFVLVEDKEEAFALWKKQGGSFVQKLRKGGYDGKGVVKLSCETDFEEAFDSPSVMEHQVDFKKELAVIVSRNAQGLMSVYDAVEMDFNPQQNLVEFLQMPAEISNTIQQKAQDIACRIAEESGIIGLLAVEFFLTHDDRLLVNEIAPRPHNSGHQTIESCRTSQYAQHLRAILNMPPGNTQTHTPSVMVNLLGEPERNGLVVYEGLYDILKIPNVYVHLYGKKICKPFRKMGHITVLHSDIKEAVKNARMVQKTIKATTN